MIVGIAGKARAGKDTLGGYLELRSDMIFIKTAFARALKDLCMTSFDLSYDQLYGELKEVPDKRYKKPNSDDFWTPREIMQSVGSFYRSVDYDYWVKQLDKETLLGKDKGYSFVITDVRHINECEYVKNNGVLVKIIRGEEQKIHGMDHESETALDGKPDEYFDIIVYNDASIEDLAKAADGIISYAEVMKKYGSERSIVHGR
jgi:hypothetical protein